MYFKNIVSITAVFLLFVFCAGSANIFSETADGNVAHSFVRYTKIRMSDAPSGWAGYRGLSDLAGNPVIPPVNYGGSGGKSVVVSSRTELISYAVRGGFVIYVDGMIDMTEGMLPVTAVESTAALDEFIRKTTLKTGVVGLSADSYDGWKKLYAEHIVSTQDQSGGIKTVQATLKNAWKNQIQIKVASNTSIIGLGTGSGIKGGTISIDKVQNVVLRNLIIQDAFDPFPAQEVDDGLNAEWDGVAVRGSKYVWIDQCTFEDTLAVTDDGLGYIVTKDGKKQKWQSYDGLLDITTTCDFVTVSWCKFMNHDKTMLIGSSDSVTADKNHQTITLHHNWYYNCVQRLPMVRFATLHVFNNYYSTGGNSRQNNVALNIRKDCSVVAENNYFDTGIKYSFRESQGMVYAANNSDKSKNGTASIFSPVMPWNPADFYDYKLDTAEAVPSTVTAGAGAGVLSVALY